MIRARMTTTRAGLTIGCAYTAPPPQPGQHAERIQAALLERHEPSALRRLLITLRPRLLRLADRLHDANLQALYRRHRALKFGRLKSLARAVWCWL